MPVKQSSITEKTGKLPDMRDLEIKQDDPDSDEEITEAKKRAPSTGGFDDDDEVVEKKSVDKAGELTPATETQVVKEEPVAADVQEEPSPVAIESPATPIAQDHQSGPKEVCFPSYPYAQTLTTSTIARRRKAPVGRGDRTIESS